MKKRLVPFMALWFYLLERLKMEFGMDPYFLQKAQLRMLMFQGVIDEVAKEATIVSRNPLVVSGESSVAAFLHSLKRGDKLSAEVWYDLENAGYFIYPQFHLSPALKAVIEVKREYENSLTDSYSNSAELAENWFTKGYR